MFVILLNRGPTGLWPFIVADILDSNPFPVEIPGVIIFFTFEDRAGGLYISMFDEPLYCVVGPLL